MYQSQSRQFISTLFTSASGGRVIIVITGDTDMITRHDMKINTDI